MNKYYTISRAGKGEYKEKGSRFYGIALPFHSDSEVKDIINQIKKEYPKASHYCYAYRLGDEAKIIKTHDDGEPHHTAGMPILNHLVKYNLTDVIIVVVRYFGGVLLGTGGLINAYGTAAEQAVLNAEKLENIEYIYLSLKVLPQEYSKLLRLLKSYKVNIIRQDFNQLHLLDVQIVEDTYLEIEPELKLLSAEINQYS